MKQNVKAFPDCEEYNEKNIEKDKFLEDRALEIYGLCKEAFNSEVTRHNTLSTRANMYLTLIGVTLAVLSFSLEDFILLVNTLPFTLYILLVTLYLATVICFSVSIWQIVKAIASFDYVTYPANIFEQFKDDPRIVILSSMASYLSKYTVQNHEINNTKAKYLKFALVLVRIGLVSLLLVFISVISIKAIGA